MITLPRLYGIVDASFGDPVRLASVLFDAGVRLVQVRNKAASARDFLGQVQAVVRDAPSQSFVIVNDRVDIARIAGAAGVHLGQDDVPLVAARAILGPQAIVGASTHNLEQALQASTEPVDYVAVGPVFPTKTKENADPALGLKKLAEICSRVRKPVVAIGGITLENAPEVFRCGAASVAVISDILGAKDIRARASSWLAAIQ